MPLPPSTGRLQEPVAAAVGALLRPYFRLRVDGTEHVPPTGPAIIAPNHDSMWDVPLLAVASPRRVVFMAKDGVFSNPFKRWLFTELGGFPIRRGAGDLGAMRSAVEVLVAGRALALFPEGTRTPGELGRFRAGAARLALETGAPLIPAAIAGSEEIWPRGAVYPRRARVRVSFGPPIEAAAAPGDDPRPRMREVTEALRAAVEQLLTR